MAHHLITSDALKRLIQSRMNALDEVQEDDEQVFAHDVERQEPDDTGCNWNMHGYGGPAGYANAVRSLVNRLRREYRLSEAGY
jgi:hypothetical protein